MQIKKYDIVKLQTILVVILVAKGIHSLLCNMIRSSLLLGRPCFLKLDQLSKCLDRVMEIRTEVDASSITLTPLVGPSFLSNFRWPLPVIVVVLCGNHLRA